MTSLANTIVSAVLFVEIHGFQVGCLDLSNEFIRISASLPRFGHTLFDLLSDFNLNRSKLG